MRTSRPSKKYDKERMKNKDFSVCSTVSTEGSDLEVAAASKSLNYFPIILFILFGSLK